MSNRQQMAICAASHALKIRVSAYAIETGASQDVLTSLLAAVHSHNRFKAECGYSTYLGIGFPGLDPEVSGGAALGTEAWVLGTEDALKEVLNGADSRFKISWFYRNNDIASAEIVTLTPGEKLPGLRRMQNTVMTDAAAFRQARRHCERAKKRGEILDPEVVAKLIKSNHKRKQRTAFVNYHSDRKTFRLDFVAAHMTAGNANAVNSFGMVL